MGLGLDAARAHAAALAVDEELVTALQAGRERVEERGRLRVEQLDATRHLVRLRLRLRLRLRHRLRGGRGRGSATATSCPFVLYRVPTSARSSSSNSGNEIAPGMWPFSYSHGARTSSTIGGGRASADGSLADGSLAFASPALARKSARVRKVSTWVRVRVRVRV